MPNRTRIRRIAVGIAAVTALIGGTLAAAGSSAAATCTLAPKLRDVTINQGLGSYATLARGKTALVRLYLSLPSCAATGSSIAVKSGTLTIRAGSATSTATPWSPTTTATPPQVVPFPAGPAVDSPADPRFVVPGDALAPSGTTGRFTATFTATVSYSAKASAGATATSGTATYTTRPGTTSPISAVVEKKTNALRILVVPMGDASQSYATQYDAAARAATVNGMTVLSRMMPVPDGIGDLSGSSGGLRYTIAPTLLDVSTGFSGGKYCGGSNNFNTIKDLLGQFLQSWNTANVASPADRVLGVVSNGVSSGGNAGCAEGMAGINSTVAWVRAIPDVTTNGVTKLSITGSLMGMEVAHTLGLVPPSSDDDFNPYHSVNTRADATAVNRGYNVSLRSFLVNNRTVMTLTDSSWNNPNTLFEPADWAILLCRLGGATAPNCATPGTVGTSNGVGGNPTFVISGTYDGTAMRTDVLESYFATGVIRTPPVPSSAYHLVQLDAVSRTLRDDPVQVSALTSDHDTTGQQTVSTPIVGFSSAVPFDTRTESIELRHGTTVLYVRGRIPPPMVTSTTVGGGGGPVGDGSQTERVSVSGPPSNVTQANAPSSISYSAVSSDGRYVVFSSTASNLVVGDANGVKDVFVRDRVRGATMLVSRASDDEAGLGRQGNAASDDAAISRDGRYVAFVSRSDNLGGTGGVVGLAPLVYLRDLLSGTTELVSLTEDGSVPYNGGVAGSPSISDDGRFVAFYTNSTLTANDSDNGVDVFVRDRSLGLTEQIDVNDNGVSAYANAAHSQISGDGRFVTFTSAANNLDLTLADTNNNNDVFVRDRGSISASMGPSTRLVSRDPSGGVPAQGGSTNPVISADGSAVAFESQATTLTDAQDQNGTVTDVYVRTLDQSLNLGLGTTTREDVSTDGTQAAGGAYVPAISDDGKYVSFYSTDPDLVPNDTNRSGDWFLRNRISRKTERASLQTGGTQATNTGSGVQESSVTPTGAVAFASPSDDLVPGDAGQLTDVFVHTPPAGQIVPIQRSNASASSSESVDVNATSANADDLRLDLFLDCPGGVSYPIAVGLTPTGVAGVLASFTTNYDPSLACANGTIRAVVNDGFSQSSGGNNTDPLPNAGRQNPTAAIYGPLDGSTDLQFDTISLVGAGKDLEDGQLAGAALDWTVAGPGYSATGPGATVDLSPPASGFPAGSYQVSLRVQDSDGNADTATTTFSVVTDADHDGLPASTETGLTCLGANPDHNAANAYADSDGDGISNAEDPQPCSVDAVPSYTATETFDPAQLSLSSTLPFVGVKLELPGKSTPKERDILDSTVAITAVNGSLVSGLNVQRWQLNSTGTMLSAQFSRPALVAYLRANNLTSGRVTFTVTGRGQSISPARWTFTGTCFTTVSS